MWFVLRGAFEVGNKYANVLDQYSVSIEGCGATIRTLRASSH